MTDHSLERLVDDLLIMAEVICHMSHVHLCTSRVTYTLPHLPMWKVREDKINEEDARCYNTVTITTQA